LISALFAGLPVWVDSTVSRVHYAVSDDAFAEAAEALAAVMRQPVGFANAISRAGVGSAASQGTVLLVSLEVALHLVVPNHFVMGRARRRERSPDEKSSGNQKHV